MKTGLKKNLVFSLLCAVFLAASWALCRYVLFDLHGMIQWPTTLFILAAAILVVSFLFRARALGAACSVGYLVGFAAGLVFHQAGVDEGGGATDNMWIIWISVLLVFVVAGVAVSIAAKRKRA